MSSFEGRLVQIAGDVVQVVDTLTGRSLFLDRADIADGEELHLADRVLVEGPEQARRGRRLAAALPHRHEGAV
jgi:hypothetical protein